MDQDTIGKEIAVILAAPVVTLIGAAALIGIVWKIIEWAYHLHIDGLKQQNSVLVERLNLANDRLLRSNQDLELLRKEVAEKRNPTMAFESATPVFSDEELDRQIAYIMDANTGVLSVTGNPASLSVQRTKNSSAPKEPHGPT